jgi:tripartite-type tricarboxylate transporter receptor subunit TctC
MKRLLVFVAAVSAGLLSIEIQAQGFPERPIQIITPYAAGGGLDIVTRAVAQKLTKWGKQVNVDNRPGAGSTVGTAIAAKAPRDGYTLLVASTPLGWRRRCI